jgi:hypothetical protein
VILPMVDGLIRTWAADPECARLADRHYSRGTVGAAQFAPNGKKLVLRDAFGLVVFVWLCPNPAFRADRQIGFNCTLFRNESARRSSDIILEAEAGGRARVGIGTRLHVRGSHESRQRESRLVFQVCGLAACRPVRVR